MKNGRTIQYHDGAIELRLADMRSGPDDYYDKQHVNSNRIWVRRPDRHWVLTGYRSYHAATIKAAKFGSAAETYLHLALLPA
jgi:hypothetical protein